MSSNKVLFFAIYQDWDAKNMEDRVHIQAFDDEGKVQNILKGRQWATNSLKAGAKWAYRYDTGTGVWYRHSQHNENGEFPFWAWTDKKDVPQEILMQALLLTN